MKKFICKLLLFCVAVFAILNAISWGVLETHRNASLFKPSFVVNQIAGESFDYIILGSSVSFTGVNTNVIDSITMMNGINLAMDGSYAHTQSAMLTHFLNQGCKTKYCILAIDEGRSNIAHNNFCINDFQFLPFISDKPIYELYRNQEKALGSSPFRSLTSCIPMLGVTYYNAQIFYSSLLALKDLDKRHNFDKKGNGKYPDNHIFDVDKIESHKEAFTINNSSILNIKRICEDNNIELIYYLPPKYNCISIVEDNQIDTPVINYRDRFNDNYKYFYDAVHLNISGRDKVSADLANELLMLFQLDVVK